MSLAAHLANAYREYLQDQGPIDPGWDLNQSASALSDLLAEDLDDILRDMVPQLSQASGYLVDRLETSGDLDLSNHVAATLGLSPPAGALDDPAEVAVVERAASDLLRRTIGPETGLELQDKREAFLPDTLKEILVGNRHVDDVLPEEFPFVDETEWDAAQIQSDLAALVILNAAMIPGWPQPLLRNNAPERSEAEPKSEDGQEEEDAAKSAGDSAARKRRSRKIRAKAPPKKTGDRKRLLMLLVVVASVDHLLRRLAEEAKDIMALHDPARMELAREEMEQGVKGLSRAYLTAHARVLRRRLFLK